MRAQAGSPDLALPLLERGLTNTPMTFYALHTANVLSRLGETGRPLLPAMKQTLAATADSKRNSAGYYVNNLLEQNIAILEGRQEPLVYPPTALPK